MKKLVALALSLVMLISAASTALAYSPEDPITIPFCDGLLTYIITETSQDPFFSAISFTATPISCCIS